jgi:hypothetical protein
MVVVVFRKGTQRFRYGNVCSIDETLHKKQVTPILETCHHHLHFISTQLGYEIFEHFVDYENNLMKHKRHY